MSIGNNIVMKFETDRHGAHATTHGQHNVIGTLSKPSLHPTSYTPESPVKMAVKFPSKFAVDIGSADWLYIGER